MNVMTSVSPNQMLDKYFSHKIFVIRLSFEGAFDENWLINSFHTFFLFLYPPENIRKPEFFYVFSRYRKRLTTSNVLNPALGTWSRVTVMFIFCEGGDVQNSQNE